MSSEDESSSLNLLRSTEPEGTEVAVESYDTGQVHDGYVDADGIVRYEQNGASFNKHAYFIKYIDD